MSVSVKSYLLDHNHQDHDCSYNEYSTISSLPSSSYLAHYHSSSSAFVLVLDHLSLITRTRRIVS